MTHLGLHEIGHQVVAEEAGADSARMKFFKFKDWKFYPGLSTCKNIPKELKWSYAFAGDAGRAGDLSREKLQTLLSNIASEKGLDQKANGATRLELAHLKYDMIIG